MYCDHTSQLPLYTQKHGERMSVIYCPLEDKGQSCRCLLDFIMCLARRVCCSAIRKPAL
ncbi:UNVERIFIED_CONTAM: hypothetical protein FKN15_012206 [Acipenser sinensis]